MAQENDDYSDEQAEAALAEAVTEDPESDQQSDDDDGANYLRDAGKKALDSMKAERNAARKELNDVREKLREYEDRDKSEAQKLSEERDRLAVELTEYRMRELRTQAATKAGLDPDFAQFINAVDEDTAAEQAQTLAEKVQTSKSPATPQESQLPQGYRGRGEKRAATVTSGLDLYAERYNK